MGPSQPQNKASSKQSNEEQEIIIINHPRFNNMKVISLPTDEDEGIIEITVALPSETQFTKWDKKVKQIGQFDYIFLPINQTFIKTQFCGSGGIATFQYYPYLLSDQIVNRCSMEGKYFEQPELWYLIYSMILAGSTFHSKNLKIGDVRPENIFISPQGQVRIATQFTWPGEQTNYHKALFQKQYPYLSPEELRDIDYGKLDESANFSGSESFSVGLTCLDAATLSNSRPLYLQNHKFNFTKLQERLQQLESGKNFSEPLVLIIKGLCQVETEKRATCAELAEWLEKYEESIIELQSFNVEELPVSLQNLRPQKPKESRVMRQSNTYVQSTGNQVINIPPSNYTNMNFAKVEQQNLTPISQQLPTSTYTSQPKYEYFSQNQPTYVVPRPVESSYERGYEQGGYSVQTVSNNATNTIFSKYSNSRTGVPENVQSGNQILGQPKPSLNLQQIDEQLNISRKMFPSG